MKRQTVPAADWTLWLCQCSTDLPVPDSAMEDSATSTTVTPCIMMHAHSLLLNNTTLIHKYMSSYDKHNWRYFSPNEGFMWSHVIAQQIIHKKSLNNICSYILFRNIAYVCALHHAHLIWSLWAGSTRANYGNSVLHDHYWHKPYWSSPSI